MKGQRDKGAGCYLRPGTERAARRRERERCAALRASTSASPDRKLCRCLETDISYTPGVSTSQERRILNCCVLHPKPIQCCVSLYLNPPPNPVRKTLEVQSEDKKLRERRRTNSLYISGHPHISKKTDQQTKRSAKSDDPPPRRDLNRPTSGPTLSEADVSQTESGAGGLGREPWALPTGFVLINGVWGSSQNERACVENTLKRRSTSTTSLGLCSLRRQWSDCGRRHEQALTTLRRREKPSTGEQARAEAQWHKKRAHSPCGWAAGAARQGAGELARTAGPVVGTGSVDFTLQKTINKGMSRRNFGFPGPCGCVWLCSGC